MQQQFLGVLALTSAGQGRCPVQCSCRACSLQGAVSVSDDEEVGGGRCRPK